MKLLVSIFIISATVLVLFFISHNKKSAVIHQYQVLTQDTVQFKTDVQPILQSRCSPCHFPGGKMFEKLPFDKAETVLTLNDRLLKRIKDSKENAIIKEFISQAANSKN